MSKLSCGDKYVITVTKNFFYCPQFVLHVQSNKKKCPTSGGQLFDCTKCTKSSKSLNSSRRSEFGMTLTNCPIFFDTLNFL